MCVHTIKNGKFHLLKIKRSQYIAIFSKSSKSLELNSSLHNKEKTSVKTFSLVVLISDQNFILTVIMSLKKQ